MNPAHRDRRIQSALLSWYRIAARDLPWRRERDPYRVWLSEILLQQTRVETVLPYYRRFIQAFPTLQSLANAPLERVLNLWQGLGYYRRGKNLHAAARAIVTDHRGRFPSTAAELQQLPGVGRYTAGAVVSIAFGEPAPAVDGNVKRVLARLEAIADDIGATATQKRLWQVAERLVPQEQPGDFNQALMELGARICLPRNPRCNDCPLAPACQARITDRTDELPVRNKRPPPARVVASAAVVSKNGRYLVVRRPPSGLLANLWGFPSFEGDAQPPRERRLVSLVEQTYGIETAITARLGPITHQFTHRHLTLDAYRLRWVAGRLSRDADRPTRWLRPADFARFAFPRLDRKIIERL